MTLALASDYVARSSRPRQPERFKAQMDHNQGSNRLLGAMEASSRKLMDPHLVPMKFTLGEMVCEAEDQALGAMP